MAGTGVAPSSGQAVPPPSSQPQSSTVKSRDYSKLPMVRLTAAERAKKSRLGLCWYCSDKWTSGHVCKSRFLVYMGSDDEDEEDSNNADTSARDSEVITADLSHVYSMDGQPRTPALEFQGLLCNAKVSILVDTGSTHNFIHPRIAEKVMLPPTAICHFRVYVGNEEFLLCSNLAAKVEVRIQGHVLSVDLHVLPIHGPDVILGLSWLRSLNRVTSNYNTGTLEFHSRGRAVCLKVTSRSPRQVSTSTLAAIMLHQSDAE